MRWPWQKGNPLDNPKAYIADVKRQAEAKINSPEYRAASACLACATNYMRKPTLGDTSRLDTNTYLKAMCETVCFLMHLCDRRLAQSVPHLRQERMDKILKCSIEEFAEEVSNNVKDVGDSEKVARELLVPLWEARSKEYSIYTHDASGIAVELYAMFFAENLASLGKLGYEISIDVQMELPKMQRALLTSVPELFRK